MSDARLALQAAVAVGAEEVVSADINRARGFLQRAEQALALQQYDRARTGAVAAKRTALWARKVAVGIREAETQLGRARLAGLAVPDAAAALLDARNAAKSGLSTQALEHASRANQLAQGALHRVGQ
jgi:hypothetical protein